MPHVIVKMISGRTEQKKTELAEQITKVLASVIGVTDDSISVAIEDVNRADWTERIYKTDILPIMHKLHKKPGYDPL
jgi:4-oxalocrotonate tautomerase